jgi:hypothetical protein
MSHVSEGCRKRFILSDIFSSIRYVDKASSVVSNNVSCPYQSEWRPIRGDRRCIGGLDADDSAIALVANSLVHQGNTRYKVKGFAYAGFS